MFLFLFFISLACAQTFDWRSPRAITTTSSSVGTTSVVIAAANLNRRCLYVWNNSANSAYLTFGTFSDPNTATAIIPTFQSFVMSGGQVYTGPLAARRNAGTGTMTTTECMP